MITFVLKLNLERAIKTSAAKKNIISTEQIIILFFKKISFELMKKKIVLKFLSASREKNFGKIQNSVNNKLVTDKG